MVGNMLAARIEISGVFGYVGTDGKAVGPAVGSGKVNVDAVFIVGRSAVNTLVVAEVVS